MSKKTQTLVISVSMNQDKIHRKWLIMAYENVNLLTLFTTLL